MALIESKIVAAIPLANGFQQITLENEVFSNAQPGHYIETENARWYIMKRENHSVDCIISMGALPTKKIILTSMLKGTPKAPPDPNQHYLIVCHLQTLGACLFYVKEYRKVLKGLVLIEANGKMPFFPSPSRQIIPYLPPDVIGSLPLLEDWGIANRIANTVDTPGCFHGTAATLITLLQRNDSKPQYHQLNF